MRTQTETPLETPVVGVTQQNNLHSFIFDEIDQGIDLYFESWKQETKERLAREFIDDDTDTMDPLEELQSELDSYYCDETSTLFGDWKKAPDNKYEVDKTGENGFAAEYSSFCGGTVSVEYSRHVVRCHHTSPCFKMADTGQPCGDLDTQGESMVAYSLPPEYFLPDHPLSTETINRTNRATQATQQLQGDQE